MTIAGKYFFGPMMVVPLDFSFDCLACQAVQLS